MLRKMARRSLDAQDLPLSGEAGGVVLKPPRLPVSVTGSGNLKGKRANMRHCPGREGVAYVTVHVETSGVDMR